jgi:hypothetical protein
MDPDAGPFIVMRTIFQRLWIMLQEISQFFLKGGQS